MLNPNSLTFPQVMDINGPTRFHKKKSPSNDRFLALFSHSPSPNPNSPPFAGDELDEDDVFWTGDFAENSYKNDHSSSPSPSTSHHLLVHHKGFNQQDGFGILAALPENEESPNHQNTSNFYRKTSVSSFSSSSRMIPVIPKPPQNRLPLGNSVKYRQSAPVNVPILKAMRRRDDIDDMEHEAEDEGEVDGEILPPHEIVARQSPLLACSVLEGVGRTLKGRDLRQVRNAVWRRTGFLD